MDNFVETVSSLNITILKVLVTPDPSDMMALELWKIKIQEYHVKSMSFKNFLAVLYHIIL
jgi:hypothetical protein